MRAFKEAVEAKDPERVLELLADDVVFNSPAVFKAYEGKQVVAVILAAVFQVFEDFEYVDELDGAGDTSGLVFRARVGDKQLTGWDYIRERDGKVAELTVMVRPLSGLNALAQAMGARLAAAEAAAG